MELTTGGETLLREPNQLVDFTPTNPPESLPDVVSLPEDHEALDAKALRPFHDEVSTERLPELNRIAEHVELSLTELLQKTDEEIGRAAADVEHKLPGAEGRMAQAENRHAELLDRREKRRQELQRQRALTLQSVERLTSVLVLPHPERNSPEIRNLRPNFETEATAMRVAMEYETSQGRQVFDVHEKNLGYDLTSLDVNSGELRLIEVKGIRAETGTVLLSPNERRVAQDRPDCFWLYVVTDCNRTPKLEDPIKNPARFPWHEVKKVDHYWLEVHTLTKT